MRKKQDGAPRRRPVKLSPTRADGTKLCSVCNEWQDSKTFQGNQCKRCWRIKGKEWADNNRQRSNALQRKHVLAKKFGMTPADLEVLIAAQDGQCAICRRISPSTLHVDHDHVTGKVRGLLCFSCNIGLGHFGDEPA